METKKFLNLFRIRSEWSRGRSRNRRGRGIRSVFYRSSKRGTFTPLWFKYSLSELTANVNYGCKFRDGTCEKYHPDNKMPDYIRPLKERSMCCCTGCLYNIGYLLPASLPADEKDLRIIARSFNEKTGFWRKGKGCSLPRRLRSPVCLSYNCSHDVKPADKAILKAVRFINRSWGYYIYWCKATNHKRKDINNVLLWLKHEEECIRGSDGNLA